METIKRSVTAGSEGEMSRQSTGFRAVTLSGCLSLYVCLKPRSVHTEWEPSCKLWTLGADDVCQPS